MTDKRWLELKEESWKNIFGVIRISGINNFAPSGMTNKNDLSLSNFWASIQHLESQLERNMDEEYYRKQIHGLILILNQENSDIMISREYIREKLNMMLNGGIGFHPGIILELDRKKNQNR